MPKTTYAICRLEKRTDLAQIRRSEKHNLRQQTTPNADPNGPAPKLVFGSPNLVAAVKALLPEKRRKNAVLAVEMVLTASPEWWTNAAPSQRAKWEQANLDWLQETYGANLVQVVRHDDEATPHLHAYWVPLVDGRLNYRAIHGSPKSLVELQDGYAKAMSQFGLARGQPKSARRHEHHSKVVDLWDQAQASMKETAKILRQLASMMDDLESSTLLRRAGAALAKGMDGGAVAPKATTQRDLGEGAPARSHDASIPLASTRRAFASPPPRSSPGPRPSR